MLSHLAGNSESQPQHTTTDLVLKGRTLGPLGFRVGARKEEKALKKWSAL